MDFPDGFNEETLLSRFSEQFSLYRQSSFKVENLPGSLLPSFSLPTLSGERFVHNRGESFSAPSLFVFLDEEVASLNETISSIRSVTASFPVNVELYWIFDSNNVDLLKDIIGYDNYGESTVTSAKSLFRDLGITNSPTIIFVDKQGKIRDVQIGAADNLSDLITTKLAFALH